MVMKSLVIAAVVAGGFAANPFPPRSGSGWVWVPITGSKCMNGQETGVWIKYGPESSKKVGIYLNGGGACFNAFTCLTVAGNPKAASKSSSGILGTDSRNPLKDYTWINVPYCTGDVHLGANEIQFAGGHRHFAGHANLGLMMERLVATFPTVDSFFVTGESAGGFGAAASYDYLRSFYPSTTRGILMDDSGPILDDTAIPVCLQEIWRKTWNINASLPKGCACIGNEGNIGAVWEFMRKKWTKDSFGLVSSLTDGTISTFFSFGLDNCKAIIPVGYNKLAAGLKRLSDSGVPVYMIGGGSHTHTSGSEFFSRKVGNTMLYQWVTQLVSDGADPHSVSPSEDTSITV